MTIIKALQCGFQGCRTSKLKRHTHYVGRGEVCPDLDRGLIEQARIFAQMRGEPFSIPGGDASAMNGYLSKRLKDGQKEANEFRKQVSREYDELRKEKGKKATMQEAERNVRKRFKWKK